MHHDDGNAPFARRREMLHLIGAAGATLFAPAGFGQSGQPVSSGTAPASRSCIATPAQTEGPYFVDERLNRSDIRSDPADGSVREGVSLLLRFAVSAVGAGECSPVAGAIVDVWHCDALGVYSDARDAQFSTVGKKFLRGYQVTGRDGTATFKTIYPGFYPGRAVHVHFKVRTASQSGQAHEFTSQLYFDDAVSERIFTRAPYSRNRGRQMRNASDGIFRHDGERLLLPVTQSGDGYAGSFHVGLQIG
jgi:protocatechuate 3,4-dioxygenase beta subunit